MAETSCAAVDLAFSVVPNYVCIRYLYRGVLPEKNIIAEHDGKVSFCYQEIVISSSSPD